MSPEDFNNVAGAIGSLATVIALAVGAYWTYARFIKQRENFPLIEFTVDMNFVGKQDGSWIVELAAYLENKGKVQHRFSDLSFDLAALFQHDQLQSRSDLYGGQAIFPHEIARRPWIPASSYFIEPGLRNKYSYVARVPEEATFLMLHGRFTYENQRASHTAERTLAVPRGNRTPGRQCTVTEVRYRRRTRLLHRTDKPPMNSSNVMRLRLWRRWIL